MIEVKCQNCGGNLFNIKTVEIKSKEIQKLIGKYRVVYQCVKCGYWSDWFDCLRWHPPEELQQ